MCEYALELTSHNILYYLWSGSIKKFFSVNYVNIYFSKSIVNYLFSMFFFPIQVSRVQNHWVAPRSTQPFILPRSVKWVPEISGNLVVKSKLPPRSGSSLEAVEPHPPDKVLKSFFNIPEKTLWMWLNMHQYPWMCLISLKMWNKLFCLYQGFEYAWLFFMLDRFLKMPQVLNEPMFLNTANLFMQGLDHV